MANGIDLRKYAAPSGSEMVQTNVGMAGAEFQAVGQLGEQVYSGAVRKIEEQKQLDAEIQKQRQKIYDSNSEAYIGRKLSAARSAVDIAMADNPSDTTAWQKAYEESYQEVEKAFDEKAGDMSPEQAEKLRNRILEKRQDEGNSLNLAMVKWEENAMNESWKLNAQLAADEEDWQGMEEAIGNVEWRNDAERREFEIETRQAGQYNAFNRQMLALNDPDKLYDFQKQVLDTASDTLNKGQRNTLAMQAQQRAASIQRTYNTTMRSLNRRLERGDIPSTMEISELVSNNRMDPQMLDTYYDAVEQAATRQDYKKLADTEMLSPVYQQKMTDILEGYLNADKGDDNQKLDRKKKRELIKEIDDMNLKSSIAKSQLYALAFEAANEALSFPDTKFFSDDPKDSMPQAERDFRIKYNERLRRITQEGELSQDFGTIFFNNEDLITKAFADKNVDEQKLMDELTKVVVSGMMNRNLKRQLGLEAVRIEE